MTLIGRQMVILSLFSKLTARLLLSSGTASVRCRISRRQASRSLVTRVPLVKNLGGNCVHRYQIEAVFVCSNEPHSAEEFPGLVVGLGSDSPVSDTYALARCDYIFGARSTFSQWASFYGEKPLLHVVDTLHPAKLENFRACYLD